MRRFIDAPNAERCRADITLKDGSKAQCGRRTAWKENDLCWQHEKQRIAREKRQLHQL